MITSVVHAVNSELCELFHQSTFFCVLYFILSKIDREFMIRLTVALFIVMVYTVSRYPLGKLVVNKYMWTYLIAYYLAA